MIALWASVALATDATGFAEIRGTALVGVDGTPWQLVERVRPQFDVDLGPRVVLSTTVEASLSEGRRLQSELQRTFDASDLGPILDAAGCEWPADPKNSLFGINDASDVFRVERLYVDIYQPKFDVRVGRQALQWGSAVLINPTDPFPEVLFAEPWRPRAGVNAARVTVPIGKDGSNQVQAVIASDDALRYARVAARGTVNLAATDFSLVGAYRGDSESGVVGLDIKGTLGVGFWFEGALHIQDQPYEELAIGADYSFPVLDTLVIQAQYYRNGSGTTDTSEYGLVSRTSQGFVGPTCADDETNGLLGSAPTADPFAPFTSARDYGLVQASLGLTPDFTVSGVMFQNLNDGSGVAVPVVRWEASNTFEVGASAQLPYRIWGRTGEFKPAPPDLVADFGSTLGQRRRVDLNGMVADATITAWTRANF